MYNIRLFVEDNGHEIFLGALIQRFASMYSISIDPRFGNAEGGFGKMVCLRNERIEAVDIAQAIGKLKTVDPNGQLVQTAKAIGISFGD